MPAVTLTRHLHSFFPQLGGEPLQIEAGTVAEVVRALEELAPGIAFYLCDELGRLRRHVNIFIEQERVRDRARLSDPVGPETQVFVMQALSGG